MRDLVILTSRLQNGSGGAAGKIAQFAGVPFSESAATSRPAAIVAHWKALSDWKTTKSGALFDCRSLFVYGWNDSPESVQALRELTAGAIKGVKSSQQTVRRISVSADARDIASRWAGLDFEIQGAASGGGRFELSGQGPGIRVIATRDGEPFFVEVKAEEREVFLLAQEALADLDAPAPPDGSTLAVFEGLVPMMLYLRRQFGRQCWQAPAPWAAFIIDDPLLRERYGFLDYEELLRSMERERYTACIAFIPWNYRRTVPRTAEFLRAHADRYSICVHGCDHTRREFCGGDKQRLRQLTKTALWRMERHQHCSGVPFAPAMVFPQGLFSTEAMEVLGESRFLAAINTSPFPVDSGPDCLALRDLLEPAIAKFSNLPLFTRQYPKSLAQCVMDVFLGKPLLLVEHHGYFRDGCAAPEEFVRKLNSALPDLQWTDLNTICSRASLERLDSSGHREIRFYTDRFRLAAGREGMPSCALFRNSPGDPSVSATINARAIAATINGSDLKIPLSLEPMAQAEVVLERRRPVIEGGTRTAGLLDGLKVFFRRMASEFRDNVVDKSPWASKITERSLQWLRDSK